MAKLTRDQVNRWNAKLTNGFQFDVRHFMLWNEKRAIRSIDLGNGKSLQAVLEYQDVREGWDRIGVHPHLHLSVWRDSGTGMLHSSGMGATVKIGTPQSKRNWNILAALSGDFDDAKLKELAALHSKELKNEFIL